MILSFVVLAVDCSFIDELAVDVDLAVGTIEPPYTNASVAGLLTSSNTNAMGLEFKNAQNNIQDLQKDLAETKDKLKIVT